MEKRRGRRGEGTTYWSRADRRWIARWPLGIVDGRRTDKRVKCRTEREALAALDKLRRIYGAGGNPATGSLDAYLRSWVEYHATTVRPSTARSYRSHIDLYIGPLLGGIPLAQLRSADIRRLVLDLGRKGKSPGYVHLIIRTLSVALNAAVAERLIIDNPMVGVRLPKIDREPVRALTPAEADRIVVAVAGTWLDRPVRVLLGSGLRRGEVLGLDQGDLLLDAGYVRVRVSKTRVRAVPVSDDAIAALREAVADAPRVGPREPVFFGARPNRAGHRDRMPADSLSHALPKLLEAAGLGHLAPHALRHGAASLMLADGVPMRVISEQLGHKNPSITERIYAHVTPTAQRAAIRSLERSRAR